MKFRTIDREKDESFFEGKDIASLRQWRCDYFFAVYTPKGTRFVTIGRDLAKSQNQFRIIDFINNEFKLLYTNTNNGNAVNIGNSMIYLRLLTTNGVEIVHYNVTDAKEIKRNKYPNDFEVNQVCLIADNTGTMKYTTAEEFMERGLFGQMKQDGTLWQFRKISDGTEMFSFSGYNLSHWSLFYSERKQLVLWN